MQAACRQAKGTAPTNLWQHSSTHYRGGPVMSMSTPTHGDIWVPSWSSYARPTSPRLVVAHLAHRRQGVVESWHQVSPYKEHSEHFAFCQEHIWFSPGRHIWLSFRQFFESPKSDHTIALIGPPIWNLQSSVQFRAILKIFTKMSLPYKLGINRPISMHPCARIWSGFNPACNMPLGRHVTLSHTSIVDALIDRLLAKLHAVEEFPKMWLSYKLGSSMPTSMHSYARIWSSSNLACNMPIGRHVTFSPTSIVDALIDWLLTNLLDSTP